MRIDIPLLPPEEPECTTLPLDGVHTIPAATPPKTPWKPRISLATKVDDLLIQAMVGDSSRESEHSATGNAATAEVVMSLSHKSEAPALPINSSSQAGMEEGRLPWRVTLSTFLPLQLQSLSISGPHGTLDRCQLSHQPHALCEEVYGPQKTASDLGTRATKPKRLHPMRKPKLSIHERSLMPRWTAPRQFWRLSVTIGWPSKKPK